MKEYPTYKDYATWALCSPKVLLSDCDVQVFRASGPGGQCVNTTDSAVRMVHRPSGITVVSRSSRSQYQNRKHCVQKLQALFEARSHPPKKRHLSCTPLRVKEHRLAEKRYRAQTKSMRRRVEED